MGERFQKAMQAESDGAKAGAGASKTAPGGSSAGSTADVTQAMEGVLGQIKELVQQLGQLLQSMSAKGGGGSVSGATSTSASGQTRPVDGGGGDLGGTQGPSARIPDPTVSVREIQLGGKSMTIGSDGSASPAEVDAAATELQRMYDSSPTFRESIDTADADKLTFTLGRRDDNTSWGGGGRVFLNLNNIEAGNNDRFQGIVGHEFAHAANGLHHGPELDNIEARVRAEA